MNLDQPLSWNFNNQIIGYWDKWELITVVAPLNTYKWTDRFYIENQNMEMIEVFIVKIDNLGDKSYVSLYVEENFVEFAKYYHIIDSLNNKFQLHIGKIIHCHDFDRIYYYDGNDLGCTYLRDQTVFKVWTPVAVNVNLVLINPQTNQEIIKKMHHNAKYGLWEIVVNEDIEGYKYLYEVDVNFQQQRTIDPYGISSDANNQHSYVIDIEKTCYYLNHRVQTPLYSYTDAIIYELSIRDFTDNPAFKHPGQYLGLTETNLVDEYQNKIGLDYLVDLGITHVQIMPFYDFGSVDESLPRDPSLYNWGYDPVQYNVPEGSYSSDPNDPYARIIELKQMINALHAKNIRVNMDVVYNHVYKVEYFAWEKLIPNYFFAFNLDNSYANATGVGNDIDSSRAMVRKFIIDSVLFWQREYGIDGFRFDLMGILDVTTMRRIFRLTHNYDPNSMIYGEAWNMDNASTALKANQNNNRLFPEIAFFNDLFRNVIIRNTNYNREANGFILGRSINFNTVKNVIAGSIGEYDYNHFVKSPANSINYVEVHDNATLWDTLMISLVNFSETICQKIHILGTLLVLVSQGIPFLHSGQELFRTKLLNHNSYNASLEVNHFPWENLQKYEQLNTLVKQLIALRKKYAVFRLKDQAAIQKQIQIEFHSDNLLFYKLTGDDYQFLVVINSNNSPIQFTCERSYKIVLHNYMANDFWFDEASHLISLGEFSFCILKKEMKQ